MAEFDSNNSQAKAEFSKLPGGSPQIVILAGGLGTRLRPLTDKLPKPLVEILGKPIIQWQIELLRGQGVRRFLLCVGHRADQIEAFLGDGSRFGVDVKYSHDGEIQLGTGGALTKAFAALDPWFMVMDGDSYLPIDFHAPIARFCKEQPLGLMAVYRNQNRYGASNVAIQRGKVTVYDREKTDYKYIHIGLSILNRQVLTHFPADRFLPMDAIYKDLVAHGNLAAYVVRRRFYEMGSFEGIAALERRLFRGQKQNEEKKSL
jgi:MurNAc alpha-1-phosphate uridylyltransferase